MSIDKWMNKEAVVVHIYNGILWTVLVAQLCPTLCEPTNCSPPSFSVHGILQTRILEWISIPFSRGSSQPRNPTWVSCIAVDSLSSEAPGKPCFERCSNSISPHPTNQTHHKLLQRNSEDHPPHPTHSVYSAAGTEASLLFKYGTYREDPGKQEARAP